MEAEFLMVDGVKVTEDDVRTLLYDSYMKNRAINSSVPIKLYLGNDNEPDVDVDGVIRSLIETKHVFRITIRFQGVLIKVQPFAIHGCGSFLGLVLEENVTRAGAFEIIHFDSRVIKTSLKKLINIYNEYNSK